MKSTMTLQVDTDTLLKLIGQLRVRGGSQDLSGGADRRAASASLST